MSKKSKNSRMGKGKGSFLRLSCRLRKNIIFMEFLNINFIIFNRIGNYFKKKNNINLKLIKKDSKNIFLKKKNIRYYTIYNQF